MRFASLITVFASISLAACGGSGSGDDTAGDDAVEPDADPNEAPDANTTTGAKQLGDACTPDQADPTAPGDCGTGMTCLALDGGNGAWCSKSCGMASGATECDPGFTGPGLGYCYLGVDFNGDNTADGYYCGIICSDTTGACTDCNSTCPSPLVCDAPLMGGNPPTTVAQGCQ